MMNQLRRLTLIVLISTLALLATLGFLSRASACPFCDSLNATFTQEMEIVEMCVMAKVVKLPDSNINDITTDTITIPKATYEIYHILKGEKLCKVGQKIQAYSKDEPTLGAKFLMLGLSTPTEEWSASKISDSAEVYVRDLVKFPTEPGERMVRMQKYLADPDEQVYKDAMSEFSTVDVRELQKVKEKMNLEQIRKAVADPKTVPSLMALNYSLLGICGNQSDVPLLESRLIQEEDQQLRRIDALVSAYLMLTKEAGLEMVEKKILMPSLEKDNFARFNATLLALRYHGDEALFISKDKIAPILVKVLDYPKRADLVVLDLSRWNNWESADRIMKLYRETSERDNPYIREPSINYMNHYLKANPKSEKVKGYLAEMERIDPAAYRRADLFFRPMPKSFKPESKAAKTGKKIDLQEKPAADEPEQNISTK